jgi:hypothetical protein
MKIIIGLLIASLVSGCATSAADRRMNESGDNDHETLKKVGVGLALLAVGAAAYYGAKSHGGGAGYAAPAQDIDWDWDEFYGPDGQLVWACRGIQTAQFAEQWRCAGKLQTDYRWPGK